MPYDIITKKGYVTAALCRTLFTTTEHYTGFILHTIDSRMLSLQTQENSSDRILSFNLKNNS